MGFIFVIVNVYVCHNDIWPIPEGYKLQKHWQTDVYQIFLEPVIIMTVNHNLDACKP